MVVKTDFFLDRPANKELTHEEEIDFVKQRNGFELETPERRRVVYDFYERSYYLLPKIMGGIDGKHPNGILIDFAHELLEIHLTCCNQFHGQSRYYTYLFAASRNRLLNSLMRINKVNSRFDSFEILCANGFATKLASYETPYSVLDAKEGEAQLETKLSRAMPYLNKYQREVFLRILDGEPQKEIARDLAIASGTMRSRLFYARKILQKHMDS